jgi:hypothetical protein
MLNTWQFARSGTYQRTFVSAIELACPDLIEAGIGIRG